MDRIETRGKHRFNVEIDGLVVAHFQAVTGMSWESEALPFQEGGRNDAILKLPGQAQLGQITLKRGYTADSAFFDWMKQVRDIGVAKFSPRKNVDVVVLTEDGREDGRYSLRRAWPAKWVMEDFDSSAAAQAVETLELAHEGLTWAKGRESAPGGAPGASVGSRMARAGGSAAARAQQALAAAPDVGAGAQGLLDRARGAAAGGSGVLGQAQSALAAAQGMRSQAEAAWRQAEAQVQGAQAAMDPARALQQAMAQAQAMVPPPPTPPSPPGQPSPASMTPDEVAQAVGDARRAAAAARGAPAAMQPKADLGARGFVRGEKDEVAAAGRAKWSDGVDEVQPATGFGEPPVSAVPRIGPPF